MIRQQGQMTRRAVTVGAMAAGLGGSLAVQRARAASTPVSSPVAGDEAWSFTDFLGRDTTLPTRPSRIAAEIGTAAALYDLGVQVHSVWGGPANDPDGSPEAWGSLPVDSVVNIATATGDPDPEKALAAGTDLFVFGAIELEDTERYSDDDTVYELLPPIAPIAVWPFLDRVDKSAAEIARLAEALGADPESPENVAARDDWAAAVSDLEAELAAKPGLTAFFGYPTPEELYIANPAMWDDVNYFQSLGLDIVALDPAFAVDWWEILSWEQALKYPTDMAFMANVAGTLSRDELMEHPTFSAHPAAKAGQLGVWSWYFARSPQGITQLLENVLAVVRDAEVVTE